MKVINVQPFDYPGSIQQRSLQVASAVRQNGVETVFLVPENSEERSFSEKALTNKFKIFKTGASRPVYIKDLASLKKDFHWLLSFPRTVYLVYQLYKFESPQVIQINGFICLQEALAAYLFNRKKVVWVLISDLYPRSVLLALMFLTRGLGRRVFVSRKLISYYGGKPDDIIIHEPADLAVFDPSAINLRERNEFVDNLGLLANFPLIVSVGDVSPVKGYDNLIKTLVKVKKTFPMVKLVVIGNISTSQKRYYLQLKNLVNDLDLNQNVLFTGYVEHKELPNFLSLAHLFVLNSEHEGTPVSILEAMAMGKAVVATNVGGISEMTLNGKVGCLVSPHNPDELANLIIHLLQDDTKRKKLGYLASEHVRDNYSFEKCISLYGKLYK